MSILGKAPSLNLLLKNAGSTFMRFPFVLVSALVATIAAIDLIDFTNPPDEHTLQRLLMAAALGLPLFIALAVFAEKRRLSTPISYAVRAGGVLLLAAYYLSLPDYAVNWQMHLARFMLLNIGLHFLVASLPYLGENQIRGFWQFNKSLLLRFLTATLFSSVMYIGLTIAMESADHLFGFDIKEECYLQLLIFITVAFNTWVFLAGVPRNLEELNNSDEYPKGLMVFTRYILLPLVALYFVILFSYEMKIIFAWNWPKGWVSQLVLWYSVVGILSLLLLHPLRKQLENRWINVFSKWFFRALIPLVIMLFLAIMRRISDYGITEDRYFVLGMAIGLFIVVLYFVFSKMKDIRIIPLVLCAGALLSAYGPWSAFSVSRRSQQTRLEKILVENEILVDGSIHEIISDLSLEDRKEMSSIISYLNEWHGPESFSNWFSDSDLDSLKSTPEYSLDQQIAGMMGFEYVARWQTPRSQKRFSIHAEDRQTIEVSSYDYLLEWYKMPSADTANVFLLGEDSCFALFDPQNSTLTIGLERFSDSLGSTAKLLLEEPITALLDSSGDGEVEQDQLTFLFEGDRIDAKLVISNISGFKWEDSIRIGSMGAQLMLKVR